MRKGTPGYENVQKMKARLAERREAGDWSDLISADRKRLVRVKVARICSFCTSTFRDNREVRSLLLVAEENLRQKGVLRHSGDETTSVDRDEAFRAMEERLEALEQAIAERKAVLDDVQTKAAEHQDHLITLLKINIGTKKGDCHG